MKMLFEIQADISGDGPATLKVEHPDESFEIFLAGRKTASILNNGDNSWQLIDGDLSQEQVNEIGEQIEKYYNETDPLSS